MSLPFQIQVSNLIKFQWRTISEDQENRFSAFRERKSQIEKDVGRTDRNHPFFAGDNNDNVKLLEEVDEILQQVEFVILEAEQSPEVAACYFFISIYL